MARRRRRKRRDFLLSDEARYSILIVTFIVLGLILSLSGFGAAGVVGEKLFEWLSLLLGFGYFLLPVLSFALAGAIAKSLHNEILTGPMKAFGAVLFFLSGLGIFGLFPGDRGGLVGKWIEGPLTSLFDIYGAAIILIALFIVSILVLFNVGISAGLLAFFKKKEVDEDELDDEQEPEIINPASEEEEYEDEPEEEAPDEEPEEQENALSGFLGLGSKKAQAYLDQEYTPPPLKLLEKDRGKPGAGDVKANANIIKRTLANFGVDVEIEEVTIGPSVTRYALKPAEGVRLSKILGLQNNLELALAAHPVRIEAPIPGRSLVGIEVPNSAKTTVGLGALLSHDVYKKAETPLFVALGRDVSGTAHGFNLAKMPHLLIAGATGSGKSVVIHALVNSLLYRNGPANLKFIMVDPKRVELTLYNGIPHLLTPVITDAKKAILALKWLITEMERRYDILEQHRVRDISSYHSSVVTPAINKKGDADDVPEAMPYIVVVIDELADIMSSYPRELEAAIVRLAQMSRAVGIHLVLSTQRPSVNVITGLIKANVPGRVALQVASQVDSRTILDMSGAEKLLGAGDMLFLSANMSKPIRVQGGFITENEVKKVSDYLRKHYEDTSEELSLTDENGERTVFSDAFEDEDEDELYEEARDAVIDAGKASTSYLQRKLRVGYARAARLIDTLEDRGVVGPADGAKPREVFTDDDGYGAEDDDDA